MLLAMHKKVRDIINKTIDWLLFCQIHRKFTKDAFMLKCLAFLIKYFLNINVGIRKDVAQSNAF